MADDPFKTSRGDKPSLNPTSTSKGLMASQHSPMRSSKTQPPPKTPSNQSQSTPAAQQETTAEEDGDAHEQALQSELATLQHINSVVEGISASLSKAQTNMATISATVTHATTLLDTWTRILAQTEHNQQLLLHPAWGGASRDIAEAENEDLNRAREKERRDAEEAAKRAAAEQRRKAEEERRRVEAEKAAAAAARPTPRRGVAGSRGRGVTGGGRGTSSYGGPSAQSTSSTAERKPTTGRAAIAGYGRVGSAGTRTARGRGTGTG